MLFCLLTGCASQVENALQQENEEMYREGKISYSQYRERDRGLDQFDEQFGKNE